MIAVITASTRAERSSIQEIRLRSPCRRSRLGENGSERSPTSGGSALVSDDGKRTQSEHAKPGNDAGHAVILVVEGFARLVPCEDRGEGQKAGDQDGGGIKAGAKSRHHAAEQSGNSVCSDARRAPAIPVFRVRAHPRSRPTSKPIASARPSCRIKESMAWPVMDKSRHQRT